MRMLPKVKEHLYEYVRICTMAVSIHTNVFWLSIDNIRGTMKGKRREKEVDRRKGGKTILMNGEGRTLLAQPGQLKTGVSETGIAVIKPTTWQGYGID